MAILIDEKKRVLVQGITGREGRARTRLMREYGTNVVGGVTPGKGGQSVLGVPVFNTPQEAVNSLGNIDVSVVFVPAAGVKDAAISAIEAGIKLAVLVPDRVPVWDAMEIAAAAKANDAMFLGPNTLGALSPGKAVVGMIGGRAESARQWFKPGVPKGVGVISRSGGMASSTGYYLGQAGVRLSSIVHIGGDAVIGIRLPDAALMFEADPLTEAIVIFGEIGSSQEEELSQLIADRKITKPVIAYIGGKAAREGTRFSHAGAIIEGGRGTHAGKVKALREAGATVVDAFGELPGAVVAILEQIKGQSLMSEADKKAVWHSGITRIQPNKVAVRGYDIAELMGHVSFGAAVYLILTGELPSPAIARLMDAILVSSIDHGATPPSALSARNVASTGATLSASVAAGIMSINRHHGGAIEDCARQLKAIADRAARDSISLEEAATRTLRTMSEAGERMSGFGHRVHTKDPRTARLFELAREAGVDGVHMQAARAVEKAFADAKKSLPINVDGAIGAILADLGMNPAAFNGIFMIARTPGLIAHVIEEQTREKPTGPLSLRHAMRSRPPSARTTCSTSPAARPPTLRRPCTTRSRAITTRPTPGATSLRCLSPSARPLPARANGKIYVAGGFIGGTSVTNALRIYDIATNTWTSGANMPTSPGVEAAAAAVVNGKFYVMGGDDFTNGLNTTFIYDIATNTWTTGATLPDSRTNTYGTASNGLIYVYGGVILPAFTTTDTLLRYDPVANSWTNLGSAGTAGLRQLRRHLAFRHGPTADHRRRGLHWCLHHRHPHLHHQRRYVQRRPGDDRQPRRARAGHPA